MEDLTEFRLEFWLEHLRLNRVKVDFQKREYAEMLGEVTEKFRQSQICSVTERENPQNDSIFIHAKIDYL